MVGEHHEHSIFENLLLNARTRLSFVYYWPQTIQIMFISRLLNSFPWLPSFRAKKILNLYSVNKNPVKQPFSHIGANHTIPAYKRYIGLAFLS